MTYKEKAREVFTLMDLGNGTTDEAEQLDIIAAALREFYETGIQDGINMEQNISAAPTPEAS